MKNPTTCLVVQRERCLRQYVLDRGRVTRGCLRVLVLALALVAAHSLQAGTAVWTGASGTDTNWSTGGNWSGGTGTAGVPSAADNVFFNDVGAVVSSFAISNVVDSTSGNFGGTIASLSYTNTINNSFQNTLIAPGVTLNVTGAGGPSGSALFIGTPTASVASSIFGILSGANAALNVNNPAANIIVDQVASSAIRATLNLTNLDTFIGNVSRIGIGSDHAGLTAAAGQGTFYLAKTNYITTTFVGVYATPYSVVLTNAIEIGTGNAGNLGANFLYLGLTNGIFTDSIGVGMVKATGAPGGFLGFNPAFTNSNPTAYFRGISGPSSRVSFWGIADNGRSGSSSATTLGTVDFSGGTVDALVDTLILGRDRQSGSAASLSGTLIFNSGTINVNNLTIGDQTGTATGSGCLGAVNVNGPAATLLVNSTLELGHTTLPGGNALNTRGLLNVNSGTVLANNIIVGAVSISNAISLVNGTLIVTNTLATNSGGLLTLTLANSTLGLTVASNASLRAVAGTVSTGGATNTVVLSSVPVFPTYPTQLVLIKYTNSVIAGAGFNIGLSNSPVTALNAFLSNNVLNRSIDLVLPTAPFPAITAQPQGLALSPGDTANYTVTATGVSALSYQWYKDGVALSDVGNVSGSGTSALSLANVQTSDNAFYSVVITNVYGSVTSSAAILFVSTGDVAPFVTVQPQSQTVLSNQNVSFSVSAAGKPLPDYHWLKNGTNLVDGGNISGSATPTLTIAQAQVPDEGLYSVTLTNAAGYTNSDSVTLTVNIPPTISVQPANVAALNGAPASFSVTATGKPAPTYQWLKNGFPITDQTNATLSFGAVVPTDAGTYSVVVSSSAGTLSSSSATLIVNSPMTVASLSPANGATVICPDTSLRITFDTVPAIGTAGRIRIFNATNTNTPVDTIDLALNAPNGTQPRTIAGSSFNSYPIIISSNTANIYPHLGVLTSSQTYFVTIENVVAGALKDTNGATFAGINASNIWRFTTKPGGPANTNNLIVAADGSGDFCTVQGALDFLPAGNTTPRVINVRNGFYTEIVYINQKNNLTFIGQDRDQVQIGYANNDTLNGGTTLRTSFRAQGNDLAFENLTLTNTTPKGGSQAEALRTDGRRIIVFHSKLASYQDTMLNNNSGDLVYVEDSLIQGDTDFIWGLGTTFLTNSEIRCLSTGSHITQARTSADTNGFSFVGCMLTRSNSSIVGCDFGRSLGFTDGNVAFIYCVIDDHITGWGDTTVRDWEYGNTNFAGFPTNYNGVQLTNNDPRLLLAISATNWLYGWQPQLAPLILTQPSSLNVGGGEPASFSVGAIGISSLTYQWLKNGTNLNGQTGATLTINSANANDAGTYSVIVSNSAGFVTSSTASLTVGNTAPTLAPVSDQTVNVGVTVNVTNVVTDPDAPAQSLSFTLLAGPGSVGTGTGVFTWRPDVTFSGTTNGVQVVVTDNGTPNLSATNSFNVIVNPLTAPSVSSYSIAGGQFALSVSGIAGPDYSLQVSSNLFDWDTLLITNSPPPVFTLVDTNNISTIPMRFYRIKTGPPLP
jgi:pectin methylesterase-like acyl-CoA thioesterase